MVYFFQAPDDAIIDVWNTSDTQTRVSETTFDSLEECGYDTDECDEEVEKIVQRIEQNKPKLIEDDMVLEDIEDCLADEFNRHSDTEDIPPPTQKECPPSEDCYPVGVEESAHVNVVDELTAESESDDDGDDEVKELAVTKSRAEVNVEIGRRLVMRDGALYKRRRGNKEKIAHHIHKIPAGFKNMTLLKRKKKIGIMDEEEDDEEEDEPMAMEREVVDMEETVVEPFSPPDSDDEGNVEAAKAPEEQVATVLKENTEVKKKKYKIGGCDFTDLKIKSKDVDQPKTSLKMVKKSDKMKKLLTTIGMNRTDSWRIKKLIAFHVGTETTPENTIQNIVIQRLCFHHSLDEYTFAPLKDEDDDLVTDEEGETKVSKKTAKKLKRTQSKYTLRGCDFSDLKPANCKGKNKFNMMSWEHETSYHKSPVLKELVKKLGLNKTEKYKLRKLICYNEDTGDKTNDEVEEIIIERFCEKFKIDLMELEQQVLKHQQEKEQKAKRAGKVKPWRISHALA